MSDAVTREEQYYRAMLGEDTAPTPITRKEKWLNRIAKALENGTGGGGASGYTDTVITEIVLTEQVAKVQETLGESAIQELQKADEVFFIAVFNKPTDQTSRGAVKFNIEINGVGTRVLNMTDGLTSTNGTPSSASPTNQLGFARFWLKRDEQYGAVTKSSVFPSTDYGNKSETSSSIHNLEHNTGIDFINPKGYYVIAETSTMFGVGSKFMVVTRRYA